MHPGESKIKCSHLRKWLRMFFRDSAFELVMCIEKKNCHAACNRIDEVLHQAGTQDIDIHKVLLAGGTCYTPAMKE